MDGGPVMMYPAVINPAGKPPQLLASRTPPGDTSRDPTALSGMCLGSESEHALCTN